MKNKIEIPVIKRKVISKIIYKDKKKSETFESTKPIEKLIKNPKEFDDFIKKEKIEINWSEFCHKYNFNDEFILYYVDKFLKHSNSDRISKIENLPLDFIEKNKDLLYLHSIASINKNLNLDFLIKLSNYFYLSSLIENKHLSDEVLAKFVKNIGIIETIFNDGGICEKNRARIFKILKIVYGNDADALINTFLEASLNGTLEISA